MSSQDSQLPVQSPLRHVAGMAMSAVSSVLSAGVTVMFGLATLASLALFASPVLMGLGFGGAAAVGGFTTGMASMGMVGGIALGAVSGVAAGAVTGLVGIIPGYLGMTILPAAAEMTDDCVGLTGRCLGRLKDHSVNLVKSVIAAPSVMPKADENDMARLLVGSVQLQNQAAPVAGKSLKFDARQEKGMSVPDAAQSPASVAEQSAAPRRSHT